MPKYKVALSDGRTFIVEADRPPNETDVLAHIGAGSEQAQTPSAPVDPKAERRAHLENVAQGDTHSFSQIIDNVVNGLPVIGGMLGATAGAATGIPTLGLSAVPGAITGATAGGAGGEALRQLINRFRGHEAPDSPVEAAKRIGTEGAIQGATEGTGQALVKGAKVVGNAFLQHAMPVDAATLKKNPNFYEKVAESRTPLSQDGFNQIDAKVKASAGRARDAVSQFETAHPNATMPTSDLTGSTARTADKILKTETAEPSAMKSLQDYVDQIHNNPSNGPDLAPTRVQEIKESAQDGARKLYDAARKGVTMPDNFGQSMRGDVADSAKKWLEDRIKSGIVPAATADLKDMNAETSGLADIRNGIKDALDHYSENPRSPIARHGLGALGGVLGHFAGPAGMVGGAVAGEALASPRVEAAIGRGLLNEGRQIPYANLMRLLEPYIDPYKQ
jgi:hypothetical protein